MLPMAGTGLGSLPHRDHPPSQLIHDKGRISPHKEEHRALDQEAAQGKLIAHYWQVPWEVQ